jgi:hypothetical protein
MAISPPFDFGFRIVDFGFMVILDFGLKNGSINPQSQIRIPQFFISIPQSQIRNSQFFIPIPQSQIRIPQF